MLEELKSKSMASLAAGLNAMFPKCDMKTIELKITKRVK